MNMRGGKKEGDVNDDGLNKDGYNRDNEDEVSDNNKDDDNMVGINDGGKANAITRKTKTKMKRIEEWPI